MTIFQLILTQNTVQILSEFKNLSQEKKLINASKDIDSFYKLIISNTVGEKERERARSFFDRSEQLKKYKEGNKIFKGRFQIDMEAGFYIWLDITCELLQNPISGDIEAILFSESIDSDVISNNMINQMISNDYDYLAIFDLYNYTNQVFTNNTRYRKVDMEYNLSSEYRETYFRNIYVGDDIDAFIYHNSLPYIRKKLA